MTTTVPAGVHPVADLFPMLPDDELNELAADIKERGQLQPIVLDEDGRILDGRNRYAACELAGVDPKFITYDGDDPDGYALAVNIARRHLTTGARAIIAAKAAKSYGYGGQKKIASFADLQNSQVSRAAMVLDWAPDLADAIIAGAKALSSAVEDARERKQEAEALQANLDRLTDGAPDLRALVDEGRMDVEDAIAALEAREEKAREEEQQRRTEEQRRAEEQAARAERISESLRMAVNTLVKSFGTDELREHVVDRYTAVETASEVNQNIGVYELRQAAEICSHLAERWENP